MVDILVPYGISKKYSVDVSGTSVHIKKTIEFDAAFVYGCR